MYRWYNTITLTMNTTKYIWCCTTCTYVFSDVHGKRDGVVLPVHMYLVVFMVSVMVLYHLYICI
jgi:hypothetical protein